ncbi:MAG: hypothetical protein ACNS63_09250 [Candidatus Nitrospinota bacterium M3_3B_026]
MTKVFAAAALAAAWAALAVLFITLWRRLRPLKKGGAADAREERRRAIAMIAKAHSRLGKDADKAAGRIEAAEEADPKKLAEKLRAWLKEGEGDKL